MILTVTMNPAVDISYSLEKFELDTVNRVLKINKTPGGKGLNVTRVLKQVGNKVIATGLLGGVLGIDIQKKLSEKGIEHRFFEISGESAKNSFKDCKKDFSSTTFVSAISSTSLFCCVGFKINFQDFSATKNQHNRRYLFL